MKNEWRRLLRNHFLQILQFVSVACLMIAAIFMDLSTSVVAQGYEAAAQPRATQTPLGGWPPGFGFPPDPLMPAPPAFAQEIERILLDPGTLLDATRGVPFALPWNETLDGQQVELSFHRYYSATNELEPLARSLTVTADADIPYALPEIPTNLPGGQYLAVSCTLADCTVQSIVEHWDSPEIVVQQFPLSPLVAITKIDADLAAPKPVQVTLNVDENLSAEDTVLLQWQVNGEQLHYTTNPMLNLVQPYQALDLASGEATLYPPGAIFKSYLEQVSPEWFSVFDEMETGALPAGNYQLEIETNDVIEESAVFDMPAP